MPSSIPSEASARRQEPPPPKPPREFSPSPPMVSPARSPKRRVWPWILLTVGVTVVVLFIGLAATGFWAQSQPLIDDDMNNGEGPFVAESGPLVDFRYESGAYVMDLTPQAAGSTQTSKVFWPMTRPAVDFEISYELLEAPDPGDENFDIGIACFGAGGAYWFMVWGDGTTILGAESSDRRALEELQLAPLPPAGRVRIVCEDGSGDAPTTVTAHLDGEQVAQAEHQNGFGSFQGVGITAGIGLDEPLVVAWDDAFAD